MTWSGVCKRYAKRMAGVWLASCAVLGVGSASPAAPAAEWHQLAKVCEAVILEQTGDPLASYAAALRFTSGTFGMKELGYYSPSRELLAIARVVDGGTWEQCLVRETEEDHTRRRALAADWVDGLAAAFPRSEYTWIKSVIPTYVNPGVLRCDGDGYLFEVRGYYGRDFVTRYDRRSRSSFDNDTIFRVFVVRDPSETRNELCGQRGS